MAQEDRNVTKALGDGPSKRFTIAATGKAFSILIDGIYSDKIGSIVREITSNAYDAHIRNGNPDVPFEVRLPNGLNPTFSVRDYGCSMDHETVMGLYSTLFESSKSDSNDEVGSFGLGAKAVFAYADAFTVNCWLDGELRAYAVAKDSDSIPAVTLVHQSPSNEPQGVEVTFAVAYNDFRAFTVAFNKSALGFDVVPKVVGSDVMIPSPVFQGAGWRVYKGLERDETVPRNHRLRQGCAVYPLGIYVELPSDYSLILDVPIGDANVTASRESLALLPDQRTKIEALAKKAVKGVNELVIADYHKLKTPLEKAWFALNNMTLMGNDHQAFPTFVKLPFEVKSWHGFDSDTFHVKNIHRIMVVVDNPTLNPPLRRRKLRLKDLSRHHDLYVETNPTTVKTMVKLLGLTKQQVMKIEDIPDVTVASRGTTPRLKKEVKPTRPWAFASRGKAWVEDEHGHRLGTWDIGKTPFVDHRMHGWITEIIDAIDPLGMLYLTPMEAERARVKGQIDQSNRIDRIVKREAKKFESAARDHILSGTFTYETGSQQLTAIAGLKPSTINHWHFNLYSSLFPEKIEEFSQESAALKKKMAARYPLLFNTSKKEVDDYIAAMDLINGNTSTDLP